MVCAAFAATSQQDNGRQEQRARGNSRQEQRSTLHATCAPAVYRTDTRHMQLRTDQGMHMRIGFDTSVPRQRPMNGTAITVMSTWGEKEN